MGFGLIFGIIGIFVGACLVYGVFMVFFPEWVGITGKTALDYERSHTEGSVVHPDDDLVERIQKTPKSDSTSTKNS